MNTNNYNNYNSLDSASLNAEVDRLQVEIDANNNELTNLISQMNIKNAEGLNLNFESAKAMRDLRDIQQEKIPYEEKKQRILEKFKLVKDFKDKSKELHNEYRKLDKRNNILKELNRILNEQLRRATIRLVVRTYSDSAIINVANTITKF